MKLLINTFMLMVLISCSEKKNTLKIADSKNEAIHTIKTIEKIEVKIDSAIVSAKTDSVPEAKNLENTDKISNKIPPDGTYSYDIAYAEWQGKSMGEKVKVIIKGNTIKIVAEGKSSMGVKNGELIDEGILVKHNVTGDWLITDNPSDADLEAYGGCVGAPMVIDFVTKKYWTC